MKPSCFGALTFFVVVSTALAAPPTAQPSPGADVRETPVRGFAFELQVEVPGSPEAVFDAFTLETLAWWDHHFSDDPVRMQFEPWAGGRFFETFDGAGNGVRHAAVIYAHRGRLLRFAGPLGLSGQAVEIVHSLSFVTAGEGRTLLKLQARGTGAYDDGIPAIIASVWRHFLEEAFAPYMAARAGGVHPYVGAVAAYRQARLKEDAAAARAVLAPDARIWFDEKSGAGSPIDPGRGGPWADWDRFFRAETSTGDARIRPRELRVTITEINDWYRLVDRPESRYFMTYWFDETNRITGMLVHPIPATPPAPDRLDAFKAWAAAERTGLLDTLLPAGRIDPALEKAKLWKSALLDWRAASGLPDPLRATAPPR